MRLGHSICCLPRIASVKILSLEYSIVLPEGRPLASLVIFTPIGLSSELIYKAVPSPAMLGLVAMTISLIESFLTRSLNDGFSGGDAIAAAAVDDLRLEPSWKGGKDLSTLKGQIVRLKFVLNKAKLYSFGLTN